MSIDLKDRDKTDVLLKVLELNENHVEWIKDMDYKVTYYTFVFLIALVVWVAAGPGQRPPTFIVMTGIVAVCALACLLLVKNHCRHYELNQEFRRIVGALQLSQVNSYSTEQIVTLRQSDRMFHFGRFLYGGLIIASGILAGLFVLQMPDTMNLSFVIDRSRTVAARASGTSESEWSVESIQRDSRTGFIRLGFRNSKTTEDVLIDFDVTRGDVQSFGKVRAAKQ